MHIFEVHQNESACRKSGRLGLEKVLLSSNTVDLITIVSPPPSFINITISTSRWIIGTISHIAWLRTIYSDLVVLSAILV